MLQTSETVQEPARPPKAKWWKDPPSLKYTRPSSPKPREDRTETAYQERIGKLLLREEVHRNIIGRDAGQGFYFVATDGHRALLRKGPAPKAGIPNGEWAVTSDHVSIPVCEAFGMMARRLLTCASDTYATKLEIRAGKVTIRTETPGIVTASEWIETPDDTETPDEELAADLTLNLRYLVDGLGRPSKLFYQPAKPQSPIIIETDDGSTRYVLAVMRP